MSLTVLGAAAVFAPSASAALSSAGPIDPGSLFPSYYADANGLQLQLCQDGLPNCLAGPDQIQDVHAAGGDAEAFYYHASADLGPFLMEAALEAAYLGDGPDQEMTFMRTQAGAKGVTANGKYTFTDPYGSYTCTADATGLLQPAKGCRFETGAIPGNFNAALSGRLGPFLTWDTFGSTDAGAPPAGFIGDNATPHAVVGSPTGFNKMRVSGPGIVGTCTNGDGSTVSNCQETDKIILQGKVQPGGSTAALSSGTLDYGDVPATPAVTKTLTYANTGSQPITIGSIAVSGAGASAFATTTTCPSAPATLDVGTRCTVDVTFTPQAGKTSAATLTVTDDTPVATRTVALKGSNLGVMKIDNPVPPAALAFPSQPVNSASAEDNVVVANTGNGPLTVSSTTITGSGAAHFKLGPSNSCATPVDPDGGCEIGVVFAPTSTGGKTANLRLVDSNGNIANVPLTGTGATSTLPGAPTGVSASAGNAAATVNWTAPTTTGGSAISGYSVRAFSGTTLVKTVPVGNVATTNVTGLTNGTAYTFDVAATNATGTGLPSARSTAVTPQAVVPAAPTIGTPASGDASATVRWTAPANDGGSAITGYSVRAFDGTTEVGTARPVGATATSLVVTGLTNGTAYTFDVAAVNAVGTGAFSARSTAVTPTPAPTAPGAPTIGAPTAGDASATVRWTAPAGNGGSAITGYSVRVFDGTTQVGANRPAGATATSLVVTGLTNGTAYTFDVAAVNAVGTGAFSDRSTAVTPVSSNAPPTVTARTPAVDATSVPVADNITATFSEAVQGVSGTTFQVKTAAGAVVAAAIPTRNGTTNQWILNPSSSLAADTLYTVTLTGGTTGIRDSLNAPLATVSWSFRTGPAPTITSRTPASGATAVSTTGNITATFSEPVTAVSGTTFVLKNAAGTQVAATVTYNTTTRVATLDPTATLPSDGSFTATLTGGATAIRDTAGNPLVTSSWTFLTGAAPTVTARSPLSAATGVSRTANITATFSEAVTGVSGTTVRLTNASTGASITSVVSYNATTRVATLNPSATLAASTRFTATLTGGTTAIRDTAGNPLATTSWSFTTGTA